MCWLHGLDAQLLSNWKIAYEVKYQNRVRRVFMIQSQAPTSEMSREHEDSVIVTLED